MVAGDVINVMEFETGLYTEEAPSKVISGGTLAETTTNARNEFCLRIDRTSARPAFRSVVAADNPIRKLTLVN